VARQLESVLLFHAPCGCAIHIASAETRVPSSRKGEQHRDTHPEGKERNFRYVTWDEAEQIRLHKLGHEFWGSRTNPNSNPPAMHCDKHADLGDTVAWYDALLEKQAGDQA